MYLPATVVHGGSYLELGVGRRSNSRGGEAKDWLDCLIKGREEYGR